jgi:nitroreductase
MHYNLSEVTDLMRNRRSVAPEHYTSRKVHKEQVELLLNNAIWAPNHGMTQPWRFVVINGDNKSALAQVSYQAMMEGKAHDEINTVKLERMVSRMNMASVIIAIIHQRDAAAREVRSFLELDSQQFCKGFFYLGYPATKDHKSHRKPIEYVTKWKWDE